MTKRPGQSGPTKFEERISQTPKLSDQRIMMTWGLFDRFWKRKDKTIDQVLSEAEQNLETRKRNLVEAIINYADAVSDNIRLQNEAIKRLYQAGSELEKKVYQEIQNINDRLDTVERNIQRLAEGYNNIVDYVNDLGMRYNTLVDEIEKLREPLLAIKSLLETITKYQPSSLEKINKQVNKIELETYRQ